MRLLLVVVVPHITAIGAMVAMLGITVAGRKVNFRIAIAVLILSIVSLANLAIVDVWVIWDLAKELQCSIIVVCL